MKKLIPTFLLAIFASLSISTTVLAINPFKDIGEGFKDMGEQIGGTFEHYDDAVDKIGNDISNGWSNLTEYGSGLGNGSSVSGEPLSFSEYYMDGGITPLEAEDYDESLVSGDGNLKKFILKIVDFALGFLGLIAVIIIIYGGILYVTAGGEPERAEKGKKSIMYATIGLLIVMGAFAFVNTVIEAGGGDGDSTSTSVTGGESASRNSDSFNAAAGQVMAIAENVYNGFIFLVESTEELKLIRNDAMKDSLDPLNYPEKSSILNFLSSARGKLTVMKSKVSEFSQTQAMINTLLREIETDLDNISLLGTTKWLTIEGEGTVSCQRDGSSPSYKKDCDKSVGGGEGNCAESFDEYCNRTGHHLYTNGLYQTWNEIRERYTNPLGDLYKLIEPIADDYRLNLTDRYIPQLEEIWKFISVVDAISQGAAAAYYEEMLDQYDDFVAGIAAWNMETDISQVAQVLLNAIENQIRYVEEIVKIEFVKARLTANIIEGNAPLTVIFDVFETEDPAGGSLYGGLSEEKLIEWDLGGDKITEIFEIGETNFDELYENTENVKKEIGFGASQVDCRDLSEYAYGESSVSVDRKTKQICTYYYPGTYRAAVKINSRNPSQYAPGISIIPITVNAPATLINLSINGKFVSKYDETNEGYLEIDKREITFTLEEAEAGLAFDASTSVPTPERYEWNFGDGSTEESSSGTTTHAYNTVGKQEVVLEVTNKSMVKDRKPFTLIISNIVARIAPVPSEIYVNTPVTFDGSGSRADIGSIREYKWEIFKIVGNIKGLIAEEAGPALRTFTYEFDTPGSYETHLKVTDQTGSENDSDMVEFLIVSEPPVALFDYIIPDQFQPSTVHFDASRSYDPDGDEINSYAWPPCPASKCEYINGTNQNSKKPIIKFFEKKDYDITLTITNENNETAETTQTITIDDIFDIAWGEDQEITGMIDKPIQFYFESSYGDKNKMAYEIDFGDGETDTGDYTPSTTPAIPQTQHTYTEAGNYKVRLTVYDEDDRDKTITKRVLIGDGTKPIASMKVIVDGRDITDYYSSTTPLKLSKSDRITFDASDSKNLDGTGRDLRYNWNFNASAPEQTIEELSSQKIETHQYKEIGSYEITLTVYDKDDPSNTNIDRIDIDIINLPPILSALNGTPDSNNPELITPVMVNLKVYGADDPDGTITQYRWWYFSADDPEDPLGVQITTGPTAQIIIGTNGPEGKERAYGYAVEITDSDNQKLSSMDVYEISTIPDIEQAIEDGEIPGIIVTNGANELPTASFTVDRTKVFIGETIQFTSTSSDPDGIIEKYIWDLEGDGFGNNVPRTEPILEYEYEKKNLPEGYAVRLKVIDDKGGEAVSDPITIYVDSHAKPPTAAFKYQVVPDTEGKKIKFFNNSTADEENDAEIISYEWDFDTSSNLDTADFDGDGYKDNDVESELKTPKHTYSQYGPYTVKLTVYDDQGNKDDVTNTITIPLANPPVAAFRHEIDEGHVEFQNNSTSDEEGGAEIVEYIWDFDTASMLPDADSDGDGYKDNDEDSRRKDTRHTYPESGIYQVKLTVIDDQGNEDNVINSVEIVLETPEESDDDDDDNDDNNQNQPPPQGDDDDDDNNDDFQNSPPPQGDDDDDNNDDFQNSPPPQGDDDDDDNNDDYSLTNYYPDDDDDNDDNDDNNGLTAVLTTTPPATPDKIVYLEGENGYVTFNFANSTGPISHYIFDKNIYYDTNENGIKNDDEDFKTSLPGNWTTYFEKSWGKIVTRLTVRDIHGNENSTTIEIKFK